MFGRDKIGKIAKEIADHFQVVESINAVKVAQKEIANSVKELHDRLTAIETSLKVAKAEIGKEAMQAAYSAVHSVQSGLNERMEGLAIKVARMEFHQATPVVDVGNGQLENGKAKSLPRSPGGPT